MRPHFHVAGFPVRVHPLFFLICFASGWALLDEPARLAMWVGIVFLSVLLHELGHALAFRRYGCPAAIELHGMGGTTTGEDAERLTHRQSAWVSFAGPAMGFLLGGVVWLVSSLTPLEHQGGLVGEATRLLLWVNVGWGLFNLLPMQPLDGGHLLASAVRARRGYRYERVLHGIGIATAVGVLALSVWWRMPWMGLLALLFGVMNFEQLRRLPKEVRFQRAAAPPRRRASLVKEPDLPEGPHDPALVGAMLLDSGLAALAVRPLQTAFAKSPSPATGHALVQALLAAGRLAELESLLSGRHAASLSDETLALIAEQARASDRSTLAARVGALRQERLR